MSRLINAVVQPFLRLTMPGIAAALEAENQFSLTDGAPAGEVCPSLYIDIEDNKADVTIITFAGMAVLYAAMPKFEFKKMLQEGGIPYNFIFVRDIHRCSYRLAPDGSKEGIAFYEAAVRDALRQVGGRRTIAIGMSGGAEAAFRISGASPIDHVIAFNPAFPLDRHGSWGNILRVLLDFPKLIRDPGAYTEVLFVTLGTHYLARRTKRLVGGEAPDSVVQAYLRRATPVTLFYSTQCLPDVRQAMELKDIPSITLVPIDSARHNCLVEMKSKGAAARFIEAEIRKCANGYAPERTAGNGSDAGETP